MKKTAISGFSIVVWSSLVVALLCTYATWHLFSFKEAFTLLTGSYLAFIALLLCGFSAVLILFESISRHALKNQAVQIVLALLFSIYPIYYLSHYRPYYNQGLCRVKLRNLGNAIHDYLRTNGRYPSPDKWCDELLEFAKKYPSRYTQSFKDDFKCPSASEGLSDYALNPDATPSSGAETVLLFECEGGWNRSGQEGIVNFENHKGECCVLFVDHQVRCIKKENFGKLKW